MVANAKADKVEIDVGYSYARIVNSKPAIQLAASKFSAFARNARYNVLYQRKLWDGRECMVNKGDGSFGVGLLNDVTKFLGDALGPENIHVRDLRMAPEKVYDFQWKFPHALRTVQEEALSVLHNNTTGIIKMVTGSGKTALFSKLIQEMGVRTLVCVPTKELLYQTAQVLENNIGGKDFKLGLWGDGKYPMENSSVVVAMYPTLVSNRGKDDPDIRKQFIETMGAFELLICDECHKVCSNDIVTKTWQTVMDINAYYRFGFSATPFEKVDTVAELLQRSAFGHIIYNLTMEKAKEDGYVTPFTVYFLKPKYPREYTRHGTTGMTWNEAHDYYIGNNSIRNQAVVEATQLLLEDGRKTLVVAQRIEHNEFLAKSIADVIGEENVYLLHGQLDSNYRKAAMAEYKARRDPCVMVASSVGNDGIDIPDISGIVLAHGGKSFFQNVQRTGRGLRTFQGKENLVFIDFDDSALGRWFQQHTKARYGYYKDLGVEAVNVHDV